jgi:hypothetical protein
MDVLKNFREIQGNKNSRYEYSLSNLVPGSKTGFKNLLKKITDS